MCKGDMMWTLIFALSASLILASSSGENSYRLPTTVEPNTYVIRIQPNLEEESFSGDVRIFVKVLEAVERIILHSALDNITEVQLDYMVENIGLDIDPEYELLNVYLKDGGTIPPGEHVLYIQFQSALLEGNAETYEGIKRFSFDDGTQTNVSTMVATDFQPVYARTAFPCFDEPHFKAKFNVRIITPGESFVALSNMKVINIFETSEGVAYDFQQTPPMPPYLLTFIVTDYPYYEIIWERDYVKVPIRYYTPLTYDPETDLTLEASVKFLEFFTDYSGIQYPLPKLDIVVYNKSGGGMENWGIITLALEYVGVEKTDLALLAHEIAHFWFGNLVTDFWWNDLWLHESFANIMATKACEALYPSANALELTRDGLVDVLEGEDLTNLTYPVSQAVETPFEINHQFEYITYMKGEAVLRMLENAIGEEKFRDALRIYLQTYSFKSATTSDLIECFEEVAPDASVREFLMSWIYQTGHPLINVEQDDENSQFILTQMPFPGHYDDTEDESQLDKKWTIPITYITDVDRNSTIVWFDKDMEQLTIPNDNYTWILFNAEDMGIYYTNYTEHMWESLIEHFEELTPEEQASLMRDAYYFFDNDLLPCGPLLAMYDKMNETLRAYLISPDSGANHYKHIEIKLLRYDENAFRVFANYSNEKLDEDTTPRYTADEIKFLVQSMYIEDPLNENDKQRTLSCIDWIKQNIEGEDDTEESTVAPETEPVQAEDEDTLVEGNNADASNEAADDNSDTLQHGTPHLYFVPFKHIYPYNKK